MAEPCTLMGRLPGELLWSHSALSIEVFRPDLTAFILALSFPSSLSVLPAFLYWIPLRYLS
jgi:hypothetical protein